MAEASSIKASRKCSASDVYTSDISPTTRSRRLPYLVVDDALLVVDDNHVETVTAIEPLLNQVRV